MIINSSFEEVDAFIVYARPKPKTNESSSNLLNGGWFIQTIGKAATVLSVKLACKLSVINELLGYSETKEKLTITFLNKEYVGSILGTPDYDLGEMDESEPTYVMTFELAVIPNV